MARSSQRRRTDLSSQSIFNLLELIGTDDRVFLQCHDFPDHDAVASAFGLQAILEAFHVDSLIVYEGDIQLESLQNLITDIGISIHKVRDTQLDEFDKVIVIDGCKGNKNVTDLLGVEIGVIDHHITDAPDDVPFADIRPELGSCCSIIHTYFIEAEIEPSISVATALMAGLLVDTALLTRGVSATDVDVYASLYRRADVTLVNSLLRNKIQVKDLAFYKTALDRVDVSNNIAFCHFPEGCNQNLLGIIGDFFLALIEVDFVFLSADNGETVNISARSETLPWSAAKIVKDVLPDGGFGGGHAEMAGGIVPASVHYDPDLCKAKLMDILGRAKR